MLLTFVLFNLVLMQTVFAWLERWLAQRRTREIMGVLFILAMLSFQLIGPAIEHLGKGPHPEFGRVTQITAQVQALLPPGLAANAIAQVSHADFPLGTLSLIVLAMVTAGVGLLLHLRLRAQFRGENLSEAAARPKVEQVQGLQVGWNLPGVSQSVAAVFEKEVRYLARSGPMLLTLIMPVFMLIIFRIGPMNPMHQSGAFNRTPDMAFPGAAAYAILVLTNLVFNSFGGDSAGMQFFYASPVTFRQIVLAKNLTHASILIFNTAFAWIAVSYLYGTPHLAVSIATLAGLLFAVPLNFAAGNLLSMYSPRKRDFSTFGRQNVSQTTVLASFGVQIVIVGLGIAGFVIARLYHNLWIATLLFLVFAAIAIPIYVVVLNRMDGIALAASGNAAGGTLPRVELSSSVLILCPASPEICSPPHAQSTSAAVSPDHPRYTAATAPQNCRWHACRYPRAAPTLLPESACATRSCRRCAPDAAAVPTPSASDESCSLPTAVPARQSRSSSRQKRTFRNLQRRWRPPRGSSRSTAAPPRIHWVRRNSPCNRASRIERSNGFAR